MEKNNNVGQQFKNNVHRLFATHTDRQKKNYTVCNLQHTLIDKRTTKLPLCRLVPTAWSTILHLLQRSKKAAVAPWSKAAKRAVGKHEEPSEDHSLHPGDRTAAGQQAGPSEGHSLHPVHRTAVGQHAGPSEGHNHLTDHLR